MDYGGGIQVPAEVARLMALAEAGDTTGVVAHLASTPGISIHARGEDGDTALHLSALHGHAELSMLCLDRGADVNARDEDMSTPLHDASAGGYLDIVRALLEYRADVHAIDSDGDSPLHHACNGNHAHVAALLVRAGANLGAANGMGMSPLSLATEPAVQAACEEAQRAMASEPAAAAVSGRRIIRAKRPERNAEANAMQMPPPPPRAMPGPTLSSIGRRPSCPEMQPAVASPPASAASVHAAEQAAAAAAAAAADPGLGSIPPEQLQMLLSSQQLSQALSNPRLLDAMRESMATPGGLEARSQADPEFAAFVAQFRESAAHMMLQ